MKFKSSGALHYHKHTAHAAPGQFDCDRCERKYKSGPSLHYHKQTAHAESGPFKCDVCSKLFSVKNALRSHKRWGHSEQELECRTIHHNSLALAAHKPSAHCDGRFLCTPM